MTDSLTDRSRYMGLSGACFSPAGAEGGGGRDDDADADADADGTRRSLLEAFNTLTKAEQEEILKALSQILGDRKPGERSGAGVPDRSQTDDET